MYLNSKATLTSNDLEQARKTEAALAALRGRDAASVDPYGEKVDDVVFLDKIWRVEEFAEFGVELWIEDEEDFILNFFPPRRQEKFDSVHLLNVVLRDIVVQMRPMMPERARNVRSERFLRDHGSVRSLQSDVRRHSMDMITVRFHGARKWVYDWSILVEHAVGEAKRRMGKAHARMDVTELRKLAEMSNEHLDHVARELAQG